MRSWLRIGTVGTGLLAMLGSPLLAERASAQATERLRVLVTNLQPIDDANKGFGRDLAKELRDLINQLPTHQPVDEDEVKDAAKRYDIEYDELNCTQSLQLAGQIRASLVFCGTVTENEDERTFSLAGVQFAAPGGVSFGIEDKTWGRDDPELAAQDIATSFDDYVTQSRHATFCGEDFESQNWEGAMTNCTNALEMNPGDTRVRFVYANVLHGMERLEEAYAENQRVMEEDPLHEAALQLAGYLAAQLGDEDAARQHYANYLQLNPGNAQVRMRVAYDLAQAGDPEGAMILAEEGLDLEADNVDLLLQHASFATRAAQDLVAAAEPGAPLSVEAAGFYQKAQTSYGAAYEERGVEMEVGHLRNMIATFSELGQLEEAVEITQRVLETHADEARFWSDYANVLRKIGRVDEAIGALDEGATRDPNMSDVKFRQGRWLVELEREEEALPYLEAAVENGERSADEAALIFFAPGYNKGINADPPNLAYGLRLILLAKTFEGELSEDQAGQIDFWHAYALYQQATEEETPQTLQTAQRTLPKFQQAARLFALPRVAAYAQSNGVGLQQFRDATQQYIEIQEAIIQRGR